MPDKSKFHLLLRWWAGISMGGANSCGDHRQRESIRSSRHDNVRRLSVTERNWYMITSWKANIAHDYQSINQSVSDKVSHKTCHTLKEKHLRIPRSILQNSSSIHSFPAHSCGLGSHKKEIPSKHEKFEIEVSNWKQDVTGEWEPR